MNLAEMTHWKPNTKLSLHGVPESFDVADFCQLIRKRFFKEIYINFAPNSSIAYQTNFKAALQEMKKLCETVFIINRKVV